MPTAVTASMLYALVMCPHRVTMDLYADPAKRDEPNPFVKMCPLEEARRPWTHPHKLPPASKLLAFERSDRAARAVIEHIDPAHIDWRRAQIRQIYLVEHAHAARAGEGSGLVHYAHCKLQRKSRRLGLRLGPLRASHSDG